LVGSRVGAFTAADGSALEADASLENEPSVLFDGLAMPDGAQALSQDGRAIEFVKDQFRHCKTILALGAAVELVQLSGLPSGTADKGLLLVAKPKARFEADFIGALKKHRHFERETDPPAV